MVAIDRNDLLAATRSTFLRAFNDALDDVVQSGIAGLFHKADVAPTLPEQGRLLDARAVLMSKDIALKRNMRGEMEHLLNRSFQTAYSTFRPSFYDSLDANSMSLIDTAVFEGGLSIDDTSKFLRECAEDQWRDLNIRVALLFEKEDINERENPFRAYLFARCINNAVEKLEIPADLVRPLSEQIAEDLSKHVLGIYKQLNELLAQHGIAAQLQLKIKKSPQSTARSAAAAEPGDADSPNTISPKLNAHSFEEPQFKPVATPKPARKGKIERLFDWIGGRGNSEALDDAPTTEAPGFQRNAEGLASSDSDGPTTSWLSGAHAVGDVLRDFFSPKAASYASGEGAIAFDRKASHGLMPATQLSQSISSFQHLETPLAEAMLEDSGRVRNLILERRDELSKMSSNSNEQMIIDIVAMLFEFILRDDHVPAEVRAQLGRLQFLVLKVALLDPELFTHKSHPARMLVNRIGTIVLDLQVLDPGGARLTKEICRIVETLLADDSEELVIFSQMLDEFDAFVAHELRTADQQIERTVQVVENAESRTQQFARISALIAEALTRIRIDPYLHDFLVNGWARVIERAERDHMKEAQRFREFVPELVWSIIPKVVENDRKQLFGMIPQLLDTLRLGVSKINWTDAQQQTIVDWLVVSHRRALRSTAQPDQLPPFSYIKDIFAPFVGANHITVPTVAPKVEVIDSVLLDEAIKELEVEVTLLDKIFDLEMAQLDQTLGTEGEVPEQFEHWDEEESDTVPRNEIDIMERLRSGVAIEIRLEETPTKAKLNWISSNAANIVLKLEDRPMPSVLGLKVFKRLMKTGRVRFLEPEPLFERAVHALLDSADQLDQSAEK